MSKIKQVVACAMRIFSPDEQYKTSISERNIIMIAKPVISLPFLHLAFSSVQASLLLFPVYQDYSVQYIH